MNQIKAKVYYDILTGTAVTTTEERQSQGDNVVETTKEQDMQKYIELKDKNIDEVDYIELEYGTLSTIFNGNLNFYSVNLETKTLDCIYYTDEEVESIEQQNQEIEGLNSRVSDISKYLKNEDSTSISDIEDYILESEQKKIITGGM